MCNDTKIYIRKRVKETYKVRRIEAQRKQYNLNLKSSKFDEVWLWVLIKRQRYRDFPCGPVIETPPYNAGDLGLIPGQGTKILHTWYN